MLGSAPATVGVGRGMVGCEMGEMEGKGKIAAIFG